MGPWNFENALLTTKYFVFLNKKSLDCLETILDLRLGYSDSFPPASHSAGHRVKTHNITLSIGDERGDLEIKDHVVLTRTQVN
jgi:hypothetical protein